MTPPESKNPGTKRLRWAMAYFAAALVLAGAMALVWYYETHRPWQEEVAALNQLKGQRLYLRLTAAGMPPGAARAQARAMAQRPPELIEIVPSSTGAVERCLTCHEGIEPIGPSHPAQAIGCVSCHGGSGLGLTKQTAHQGLLGRNPSRLDTARASCGGRGALAGQCHTDRKQPVANMVYRVRRTIMATATGVITSLRAAWLAQPGFAPQMATLAIDDPRRPHPAPKGTVRSLIAIPGQAPEVMSFPGLADEHYRKFCARCHLNAQRDSGPSAHGAGCAACHGLRQADGRYHGQDLCIDPSQSGHAASHRLEPTPKEDNCRRCHNRSGRIGLNYQGWMEDEGSGLPWSDGNPANILTGGRAVRRLTPDVHAEKGMTCIDCHTPQEIMGDGRIYERMRFQTDMRCSTCHSAPDGPRPTGLADAAVEYELAFGPLKDAAPLEPGQQLILSVRRRPVANLRKGSQGVSLHLRSRPGVVLKSPLIENDPGHGIPGHQRLTCQACHSRWTPQCYGCHDYRSPQGKMWDYAENRPTPGTWKETRDIYRFSGALLGVDWKNQIRPFAPGCQVVLTVLGQVGDPQGQALRVAQGKPVGSGLVMTPISPHTTRREVRPCESCHHGRRMLGLGGGPALLGRAAAQPVSDLMALGRTADWDAMSRGQIPAPKKKRPQAKRPKQSAAKESQPMPEITKPRLPPLMGSTHGSARPLNRQELEKVLRFGSCLPCHRKPQDPVVRDASKAYARIAPGGDLHARHKKDVEKALQ